MLKHIIDPSINFLFVCYYLISIAHITVEHATLTNQWYLCNEFSIKASLSVQASCQIDPIDSF